MNSTRSQSTRKAILIGCPGGTRNEFLSGVQQDLKNMSGYLQSELGGGWHPAEIQTFYKPSASVVRGALGNAGADYLFVYFSGHGYTDAISETRVLCLQDTDVPDKILLNQSKRQLVIVDACRNKVRPSISGIPQTCPEFDYFADSPARELFDSCIQKSPAGKLIVYSTTKGKPSYDTNDGGMFTNALLHVGWAGVKTSKYTAIPIEQLLDSTHRLLKSQGNQQVPSVAYRAGNLNVPFAIGIPESDIHPWPSPQCKPVALQPVDSNIGLWAIGLCVIGFFVFTSKSRK